MAAHVGYIPVPYAHLDPYNLQYTVNTVVCSLQSGSSRKLAHNFQFGSFGFFPHSLSRSHKRIKFEDKKLILDFSAKSFRAFFFFY